MKQLCFFLFFCSLLFSIQYTVNLTGDNLSFTTLRKAIDQSNTVGGINDIIFTLPTPVITLSGLDGPLPATTAINLIIDGSATPTNVEVNGASVEKIFGKIITPGIAFDLRNLIFKNATTPGGNNGSVVEITSQTTSLNVDNCTFDTCTSGAAGGAIEADNHVVVNNSRFINCSAPTSTGGAIRAVGNIPTDALQASNSFFSFCSASVGGAIWSAGNIKIFDSVFEDCSSTSGGGVIWVKNAEISGTSFTRSSSTADGRVISTQGNLTISNCSFDDFKTTNVAGQGGAIYKINFIGPEEIKISSTSFKGGTAPQAQVGGAIYCEDIFPGQTTIELSDVSFEDCSASDDGGAIFLPAGAILKLLGPVSFSNNTATRGKDIFMQSTSSLIFDTTATVEIPNPVESEQTVSPDGGIIKRNTGKLSLNGDNTYTGSTTIEAGELHIEGSVITSIDVQAGSILSGDIVIYNGDLTNTGGNILPGNGNIGEIRLIHGKFEQTAGTLEVDITPTALDSDKIFIETDGASTFAGTLQIDIGLGNYIDGTLYKVIDGVVAFDPDLITLEKVGPLADKVNVKIEQGSLNIIVTNTVLFACGDAAPGNPLTMETAIKNLDIPPNSPLSQIIEALGILPCPSQELDNVLNKMTAANLANLEWITLTTDTQISALFANRIYVQECQENRCQCKKSSIWAQGLGNFEDTNTFDWLSGYDANTLGGLVGFDTCTNHIQVGFGGGYTYTDFSLKDDAGFGDIHSGFGALYASFLSRNFIANASVMIGGKHFDMNRKVAFLMINEVANSKFNSPFVNTHLGLMAIGNLHDFRLEIFANADYHYWYREALLETGTPINLFITKHHSHFIKAEVGTNLKAILNYQNKCFVPFVGFSIIKKFPLGKTNYNARFEDSSFCMYTLTSSTVQELASPRCGLRIHTKSFAFSIGYRGEFNKYTKDHQVDGGLEWTF
ncbi:MAG: Extracellular serine protease [Chlamydiae bacterium]|nr:Extracellular serine protease [Chlamydiota bacterium]